MKSIRVLLADPQPLVRAGLRMLMEQFRGVSVVDEIGSGPELLEILAERPPDIVVTEMTLQGGTALDIARRINRHLPQVKVLLLSAQIDNAQVQAGLRAGVLGFVSKAAEPAELEIALRAVAVGNPYLSPQLARFAIDRRRSRQDEPSVILPTRQREVLQLLGRGKSTKEIAALMGLSVKTVETHRSRLMQALELSNINALLHYAVRHELQAGER
ncbi:response regulator [Hydrocarboniphaga sp.]|uniref:response regulator n=1 Tax=Hydrocarboniphaga sp. TaxID=2033016 RepID=UPI003D0BDD5F